MHEEHVWDGLVDWQSVCAQETNGKGFQLLPEELAQELKNSAETIVEIITIT